jgi:hypothetical protein
MKSLHFLVLFMLAFPVQSGNCRNGVTLNDDSESASGEIIRHQYQETSDNNSEDRPQNPQEALYELIDGSIDFSANIEVIMHRIEEWFVQIPVHSSFSAITNSSYVFKKLAEYVVESKRGEVVSGRASLVYSSNENVTIVEFASPAPAKVTLTLLYRASEHKFRTAAFLLLCDRKGPTITLVKAGNGKKAAFFNSVSWVDQGVVFNNAQTTRGFAASIDEDDNGVFSLQKYNADERARVFTDPGTGPWFGRYVLKIVDQCNLNELCHSILSLHGGYNQEGMAPVSYLFGSRNFRVSEYEVFLVALHSVV